MWWVLPAGVRQGTAFTHCEIVEGCGSKRGAPTSLGTSWGKGQCCGGLRNELRGGEGSVADPESRLCRTLCTEGPTGSGAC